jgi:Protein of unknown function (DUF3105)
VRPATISRMPPTPRPRGPKKKINVKVPATTADNSNRRLVIMIGIAGLVVVAAGLGYALLGGGGSSASTDAPKLLEAAGCTFQSVKSLPAGDHSVTTPGGTSTKWNTSPPTNGPHYQVPAIWGAYTEPLLAAQVVHNLEHGGIFIQYGPDVPQSTIDELRTFYDSHQNGTLLAPLPSLGDKIALGVWTTISGSSDSGTAHLAKCTAFDEKAFAAFFDAYQFKGPERFPPSSLVPGS